MEPNAKKQKLNPSSPAKLEFLDINDDCIRHILWNLSPADLCSLSFTCARMQELLFDHFPRQYPEEHVTIALDEKSKKPNFSTDDETKKHVKYFSKCIRNVEIVSSGTHKNLQCLFDFLNAECCTSLQTLQLNIAGHLKPEHIEVVKSHLENLSTLIIKHPYCRYDIHDTLLKHCKKLEHLDISSTTSFDASWMLHKYPTMKSLSIDVCERKETQVTQFELLAKKFFQLNPQITNVECQQLRVIRAVLRNAVNIERFAISLDSWMDFRIINRHLKEYGGHSQIKWLELSIGLDETTIEDYEAVKSYNDVQPIHSLITFLYGSSNELTFLSQLKLLRNLDISVPYEYGKEKELLAVISELPNLENLALNLGSKDWVFKDVAMKFVRNSVKLRYLSFRFCIPKTFIFHPYDLFQLNQSRASISHATPMVFQLDYPRNYYNFSRPTFIHPATPVLSLKFTALHGQLEL